MVIVSNPTSPVRPLDTVSLHCHVELENRPELDIPLTVDIQWITPFNRTLINNTAPSVSGVTYSNEVLINSFDRYHSGVYTCMAAVTPTSTFINGSLGRESLRITVGK